MSQGLLTVLHMDIPGAYVKCSCTA